MSSNKEPTYDNLMAWCQEYREWIELERINIHNKLGEPERQDGETLHNYKKRLKAKQMTVGYSENDFIII